MSDKKHGELAFTRVKTISYSLTLSVAQLPFADLGVILHLRSAPTCKQCGTVQCSLVVAHSHKPANQICGNPQTEAKKYLDCKCYECMKFLSNGYMTRMQFTVVVVFFLFLFV